MGLSRPVPLRDREDVRALRQNIRDWRRLWLPWDGLFAGKNVIFRFVAVVMTLSLVTLVVFLLQRALASSISDFISGDRLRLYGNEVVEVVQFVEETLDELPARLTFLDNSTQKMIVAEIKGWTGLTKDMDTLESLGSELLGVLQGFLASSGAIAQELVFFLLYTFLYLFDPLEINTTSEFEAEVDKIYTVFSAFSMQKVRAAGGELGDRLISAEGQQEMPYTDFYRRVKNPTVGVHKKLNEIIQVYFKLSVFVNAAFAVAIGVVLYWLRVDLAVLLAVVTFFLAFIPEVGVIISIVLPLPIMLLADDKSLKFGKGFALIFYTAASISIKVVVSNVVYPAVMGKNQVLCGAPSPAVDRLKTTHPVVVLLAVVLAGDVWGPVGMLLSVPLISLVRLGFGFWFLKLYDEADCSKDLGCSKDASAAPAPGPPVRWLAPADLRQVQAE